MPNDFRRTLIQFICPKLQNTATHSASCTFCALSVMIFRSEIMPFGGFNGALRTAAGHSDATANLVQTRRLARSQNYLLRGEQQFPE